MFLNAPGAFLMLAQFPNLTVSARDGLGPLPEASSSLSRISWQEDVAEKPCFSVPASGMYRVSIPCAQTCRQAYLLRRGYVAASLRNSLRFFFLPLFRRIPGYTVLDSANGRCLPCSDPHRILVLLHPDMR